MKIRILHITFCMHSCDTTPIAATAMRLIQSNLITTCPTSSTTTTTTTTMNDRKICEIAEENEKKRIHQINSDFVVRPELWLYVWQAGREHMGALFSDVSNYHHQLQKRMWNESEKKKRRKSVAERKRENYLRINTTVRIRHASLATHTPELVNKTNAKVTAAPHVE